MDDKLVNILNEMAEYLSIPQMKVLQETLIKHLCCDDAKKRSIDNHEYLKMFLDAKRIEGCSERTKKTTKIQSAISYQGKRIRFAPLLQRKSGHTSLVSRDK